jgi:hypothetical protein
MSCEDFVSATVRGDLRSLASFVLSDLLLELLHRPGGGTVILMCSGGVEMVLAFLFRTNFLSRSIRIQLIDQT